jgi:hypothetical protein
MTAYSLEVIQAAGRVGRIFASGCDRCDRNDLEILENAGLMIVSKCSGLEGLDSLKKGESMWTFNEAGSALVASILDR